jgi:hypothetical protein
VSASQNNTFTPSFDINYQVEYPISINGEIVGTFTFSGGTGLINGSQPNTLTIDLPTAYEGETITLFTFSGSEGAFDSLELTGVSCQQFQSQIVDQGEVKAFQIIFSGTSCATLSESTANSVF